MENVELEINTFEYHGRVFETGGFIFMFSSLSFFCILTEFLTHLCVKLGSSSSITIQIIHCELWRAAEKNWYSGERKKIQRQRKMK